MYYDSILMNSILKGKCQIFDTEYIRIVSFEKSYQKLVVRASSGVPNTSKQ